jgi:GT2 family glycosyltransferase
MNKVYIIIVNFNNFNDTIEGLESLLKSAHSNFQIFVVDNSTSDTSIQYLHNWAKGNVHPAITTKFNHLVFPAEVKPINHVILSEADFLATTGLFESKITFIRATNNGFAAANNLVLKYLTNTAEPGSFIWLLNNDTVVEKNTLTNLLNFYHDKKDKKYIVGPLLRNYNEPNLIQAVIGHYNIWLGKHTHIGENEHDNGQYANYTPSKNAYVIGAAMFFPLQLLKDTGLMSEAYFLYFEELDWLRAAAQKGYVAAVATNAIVYHKEGASIAGGYKQRDTSVAEYYSIINRVRFIKKWHPRALPTVLAGVIFALLKRLLHGHFKLVSKASIDILKTLFTIKSTAINYHQ